MPPILIPVCWPVGTACACGRRHQSHEIGKAPLVRWSDFLLKPPAPGLVAEWRRWWPLCNWGELLEPAGILEIDLDSEPALSEATALGLPPAPVMRPARGRRFRYLCPPEVAGRRTTRRGESHHIDVLGAGYGIVEGLHVNGVRYAWSVPPTVQPPGPAPAWAVQLLAHAPAEVTPIDLSELEAVTVEPIHVSPRILALIADGGAARYPSRSEALWAVLMALIEAGYTDVEVASIVLDPAYGISSKPREKGRRWLAGELARARAKSDAEIFRL